MRRIRLTAREIEALLAAAGNADPAMWEDYPTEKEGDERFADFASGMDKLRELLARHQR